MSVNYSVLSCVPNSVSAHNAESDVNSMLLSWKEQSINWDQETADIVGKAVVDYVIKWNKASVPVIEEKISNFKAVYDAKKIEYDSAKAHYDAANQLVKDAEKDIKAATESNNEQYQRETGFISNSIGGNKRHVVNRRAYDFAMHRKREAEAERSSYKAQMQNWKKKCMLQSLIFPEPKKKRMCWFGKSINSFLTCTVLI